MAKKRKEKKILLYTLLVLLAVLLFPRIPQAHFNKVVKNYRALLARANTWTATQTFGTTEAETGIAGVSKYFEGPGTTLTGKMLGGGMVYYDSLVMGGVTVPPASGNTAFVVVKDPHGTGVTVFTANNSDLQNNGSWGTKIWVAPGNLGHQVALTSVDSGVSGPYWDVVGSIGNNWTVE